MENNTVEKKESLVLKFLGKFLLYFFPIIKVFSLNRKLSRIYKIRKNDWVRKQKLFNYFWAFICSAPILLALFLTYVIITKEVVLAKQLTLSLDLLSNFQIGSFFDKVSHIFKNPQTMGPLNAIKTLLMYGFLGSFINGVLFLHKNPLITESKKLYQLLQKNGFIDRDDNSRLVFATPEYFLVDLTGSNPKELIAADRIWRSLNVRVENFYDDPDQRAVVVFQIAFELEDKYVYELPNKF